jgi:hypothetical protein
LAADNRKASAQLGHYTFRLLDGDVFFVDAIGPFSLSAAMSEPTLLHVALFEGTDAADQVPRLRSGRVVLG